VPACLQHALRGQVRALHLRSTTHDEIDSRARKLV
jgi:hypothetical protein